MPFAPQLSEQGQSALNEPSVTLLLLCIVFLTLAAALSSRPRAIPAALKLMVTFLAAFSILWLISANSAASKQAMPPSRLSGVGLAAVALALLWTTSTKDCHRQAVQVSLVLTVGAVLLISLPNRV